MSAMVAFKEGEVFLKSVTFENLMLKVQENIQDTAGREIISDALEINCLWFDQIESQRNPIGQLIIAAAHDLRNDLLSGDPVAREQLSSVRNELRRRLEPS